MAISRQARSTLATLAMSAIEQPAPRSGSIVACWGLDRMSATSAMKCTPQKTMYWASVCAASFESCSESPVRSAYL
ncbi:hypothetical protein D3C83_65940 [compost metagenome]